MLATSKQPHSMSLLSNWETAFLIHTIVHMGGATMGTGAATGLLHSLYLAPSCNFSSSQMLIPPDRPPPWALLPLESFKWLHSICLLSPIHLI